MGKNIRKTPVLEAVKARIAALKIDDQARFGRMNASQMLCHCADQIRVAFGEVECADVSNAMFRTVGKWGILGGAPFPKKGVDTMKEIDQSIAGTAPTDFEADRNRLLELVDRLAQIPSTESVAVHPYFGKMSPKEWGRLAYRHLDHHLNQFGK